MAGASSCHTAGMTQDDVQEAELHLVRKDSVESQHILLVNVNNSGIAIKLPWGAVWAIVLICC